MDVYLSFSITALFLVTLSLILRKVEKSRSQLRFLWLSSVVPLAMGLGSLLLDLYTPYASRSLLYYLSFCLLWCEYPGIIIAGLMAPLFGGGWYTVVEKPVWHCVAFVVSFVLYTLMIFVVIRIALYLKKRFWSGNASMRIV